MRAVLAFRPEDPVSLEKRVSELDTDLRCRVWTDLADWKQEMAAFLPRTALIWLGESRPAAEFLCRFDPVCPVLTADPEIALVLREEGWNTLADWPQELTSQEKLERLKLSLEGLALGDALGEMLSHSHERAPERLLDPELSNCPWYHTDDTEMALALASVLCSHGRVQQDALATRFVRRFQRDSERSYGKMTRLQLTQMAAGDDWREVSREAFSGRSQWPWPLLWPTAPATSSPRS